jgi:hypothetical protein
VAVCVCEILERVSEEAIKNGESELTGRDEQNTSPLLPSSSLASQPNKLFMFKRHQNMKY